MKVLLMFKAVLVGHMLNYIMAYIEAWLVCTYYIKIMKIVFPSLSEIHIMGTGK